MARRGDVARQEVVNTIATAFGNRLVAIQDKKIYVTASDGPGGEVIQFAISITMPKVQVEASAPSTKAENGESAAAPLVAREVKLSEDDKAAVAQLMKDLGLE